MTQELRFDGRVAIVTGAGNGLGRSHALLLASRGAKVVVNDLGGGIRGEGQSQSAADRVVEEITAAGGQAVADYHSVENGDQIVQRAIDAFGRIDIVVNNAGILRDVSFAKMTADDWDLVYRVHVLGAFRVTHAAWPHLREQKYGRVVMTASAAGIYGNFGQANYSMAKLGLVGLSNTLAVEGRKANVHVNTIAPIAGSRLTETVLPKELIDALRPEYVSPLLAWLCHESCEETGGLYEVGGGFMAGLRWQRAAGATFRLGRTMTPEAVQEAWKQVTGFDGGARPPEYPADITSSMAPILGNIQAGPSKGGNQFIDVDRALGYQAPPIETSYDERDLSIYALGVGAAEDPLDDNDLSLVYELHSKGFRALPTYAAVPALNGMLTMAREGRSAPGLNVGPDRILHGEQYTRIVRPLPPRARLTHKTKLAKIYDKGKHALLVYETRSYDETGEEIIFNETTSVVRGAGGWGGERGPSEPDNVAPARAPDAVERQRIHANQALLYRLSGDWNPLHADPGFARAFGFNAPILHGLCTFGYAARHVIKTFAGGDPRTFKSIKVRFADSVMPGETLVTEMWKESGTRILFQCKVAERDKLVISNGAIELYPEVPAPKAKPKAAAPAAAAAGPSAPSVPTSADIFAAMARYVRENADAVKKVGVVYQFALTDPASVWTVDLKNGAGSVTAGEAGAPECKLELADADFMAMCTGQADPQKLYFGGKLKISGNVMASQKLSFLSKIDPAWVLEAMRARGAGDGQAAAATAAASGQGAADGTAGPSSGDVFVAIRDHVERSPELKKIAVVYQFRLRDPDSVWTVDLVKGEVASGESAPAGCTLELDDVDFMAMVAGKADPQKLYFGGKLKISGNVMASQKLTFLSKMDPERAKQAVLAARGAAAPAAPAAGKQAASARTSASASSSAPAAPALMDKLAARIAANPGWVKEVAAVIGLVLTDPASQWTIDLKSGAGSVAAGAPSAADCTLTLSERDLGALIRGETPVRALYQGGKLRVDGDVRVAQRLEFMKSVAANILPKS
ncbi:MAG TPA: SDR family NAD(P)-dependent oxidoreductase [Kofleriaceae bacterium]|nr:SDR family NAD(P)-dependent oxidoreductase [Kofleriaceae bacterium]